MTTRELTEAIQKLVKLEIARSGRALASERAIQAHYDELIELQVRQIADGFKEHSAAKGVYVETRTNR